MDAHTPSNIAMSVAPVRCPVVPPGKGRVNIITIRLKAEARARKGIWDVLNSCLTFLDA
jgi:hypothetical protein